MPVLVNGDIERAHDIAVESDGGITAVKALLVHFAFYR